MIEVINMYEDLRSDKVGLAIMALRAMPIWNKEKQAARKMMDQVLTESGYTMGTSTANKYHLTSGSGFSYLYEVPATKRGLFSALRGRMIRIVYTFSGHRMVEFMFAQVKEDQQGRSYRTMGADLDASDFDVRRLYKFAYGESEFNAVSFD